MRIAPLVLVVTLTACAGSSSTTRPPEDASPTPSESSPPPATPENVSVDGSWVLTSGEMDGVEIPMVEGYRITLTFDGDQVGGTAACNEYGATLVSEPPEFQLDEIYLTMMACEPPEVMDSEHAFLEALGRVTSVTRQETTLQLTGEAVDLPFDYLAPVPTADLIGTVWTLETVIEGETASSVAGERATLELNPAGILVGSTGCRALSGTYVVSGDEVRFTNFSADGECSPELARQDNQVLTVLGDGFTVEIDGNRLTLTSVGNESLIYRKG